MKAIARDIVMRRYDLIVNDRELSSYRRKNKISEQDIDSGGLRINILIKHVKDLIGDVKKRECTFIYSGSVSIVSVLPRSLYCIRG